MDIPDRSTTRPAAGLLLAGVCGLLLTAACSPSISIPSSSSSSQGGAAGKATPSSRSTAGGVQSAPTPGPASSGSFDAVHAAAVAAPAVAMIIVQTGSGVAQGSGVAFQSGELGSSILTNNHVVAGGSR